MNDNTYNDKGRNKKFISSATARALHYLIITHELVLDGEFRMYSF